MQNTLVSHILSRFWPKKVQIRPFYTYFAHLDRKMCETPGFCTFFRLLRHPAAHLMSKNAHPCSRNHRFPHLVSKTAPARSRTRRSPFAANDFLRFRRYSLPLHRLQGSPLKARDSGPAGGVRFRVNLGDNWVAVWHGIVFFFYEYD